MPVVHFDDFDVPIVTQSAGRLLHQCGEHCNTERSVAGLQNWNIARCVVNQEMVPFFKTSRSDDDRFSGGDAGVEISLERVR